MFLSKSQRLARFFHQGVPEIWVRFLLAIAGLILAFAAAIFSSVARESGNLWATLILASAALLLATIVGLTTVPYLARRIGAVRIREAFDYDVTRVGIIYVVTVLLIGIAALNTGNNLLYIVVAVMLAAIVVSGFASALVLRNLELDIRLPEHVFAGRSMSARILLRNSRKWLPSFSANVVSLEKAKPSRHWRWLPSTFAVPRGRPPEKQWIRLPDRQLRRLNEKPAPPNIFNGSAYFPYLPARASLISELELKFERRGRYQQERFGLATRFPFAFLTKTRRVPLAREVIVYPSVEPTDEFFEVLPLITGEFASFMRGRGNDLYRIREYMPEDSARHVDWKASAKSGSLKVREFSREDERKLRIVFDNPQVEAISAEAYEGAVALAASLGWHFTGENTDISFVTQGYRGADIYQFLEYLAVVQSQSLPSVIDEIEVADDYNIILTARARGTIPTALWACSYFVFLGNRQ
ncbi:MAG: hypothetical protein AUI17_02755 [Acidobacteriales bacterium 13_2_20CM_2_55_5]|jgi:uncharacterized protein (DUF58 family)|nr:MAG: hypothetical protein AUI17_02755 [Acidobacteriales bacterium 13_2_20CM_2_55_5]